MKEHETLDALFRRAELHYPVIDCEAEVLQTIRQRLAYRKQKKRYAAFAKAGLVVFAILCLLFLCVSADMERPFYLLIGIPFILLLCLVQLELVKDVRLSAKQLP